MVVIWSPVTFLFIFFGTMILLLAALSIFVWLAARSKNINDDDLLLVDRTEMNGLIHFLSAQAQPPNVKEEDDTNPNLDVTN
jgi:hypothetical protein